MDEPVRPGPRGSFSVVIATYSDDRWEDLLAAVESVQEQTVRPEVVVAVDHNSGLLERVRAEIDDVVAVANSSPRGASGTRNTGVAASRGDIVLFMDDDAVASRDWVQRLVEPLDTWDVAGVGGRTVPLWEGEVPRWFPAELGWVIGATDECMPAVRSIVRNVWTGNMAVRRSAFEAVGGFRPGFGLVGGRPWPEDTDLCLRVSELRHHDDWLFEPSAEVRHKVPRERARVSYFLARSWHQGATKAQMASLFASSGTLLLERQYAVHKLPRGVARGLADTIRGHDPAGIARAGMIVTSLTLSTTGLLSVGAEVAAQRMLRRRPPSRGTHPGRPGREEGQHDATCE